MDGGGVTFIFREEKRGKSFTGWGTWGYLRSTHITYLVQIEHVLQGILFGRQIQVYCGPYQQFSISIQVRLLLNFLK